MRRYEALMEQFRQGKTELPEMWVVCPTCMDAQLATTGAFCSVCDTEMVDAPLFPPTRVDPGQCDSCRFALSHVWREVGRFKICGTCDQIASGTWPYPGLMPISQEKAALMVRRCETIASL